MYNGHTKSVPLETNKNGRNNQQKEHYMTITFHSDTPVYYGGFDPGSGEATLSLIPTDDVDLSLDIYTLPSLIADGKASQLLGRGHLGAQLSQVLSGGDYVL